MRTSPFGAKGLRTVRDVGGIITAIASRQWPTNIAAAGQGIGQPFENARRIDAVGLSVIGNFIGMTRPSIALQVSAFGRKAGMPFCTANVRYWHKADMGSRDFDVYFEGKAGIIRP